MSKEYLHIKEPCQENWNAMSPAAQGRFCQSCAKTVIDFSQMSDKQILDIVSKAPGNTCGRFTGNQLERPLAKDCGGISLFLKPYKVVLSSLVPLFIVSANAVCQDKQVQGKVAAQHQPAPAPVLMGDVVVTVADHDVIQSKKVKALKGKPEVQIRKPEKLTVKGKVVNKDDEPLPYATVMVKGIDRSITADSTGTFSFLTDTASKEATISATHASYEHGTANICLKKEDINNVRLVLEQKKALDTVTVVGYASESLVGVVGGISIVKTVSAKDTLKTLVQKLFNTELFKVFPNPAVKGQTLHIRFKKEGDYAIQLFDNAGRLYVEKQLKSAGKGVDYLLALPPALGSGSYYLKGINTTANKQSIEKVIVL